MNSSRRIAVIGELLPWIVDGCGKLGITPVALAQDDLLNPRTLDAFAGVLILEERQDAHGLIPRPLNQVILGDLESFAARGGRVFAEACYGDHDTYDYRFAQCFGFSFDPVIRRCDLERICVSVDHPAIGIAPGTLLEEYRSFAVQGTVDESATVLATYGRYLGSYAVSDPLPDGTLPAIVSKPIGTGKVLYASFPLSRFEKLTYRPQRTWRQLSLNVLAFLAGVDPVSIPEPAQTIVPHPSTRDQRVENCRNAIARNIEWFRQSGVLPQANGKAGVWEAVQADCREIRHQVRPDCNFEAAMAFVLAGKALANPEIRSIGEGIAWNMFANDYQQTNTESPAFGCWNWLAACDGERMTIFEDDNSWALIGSLMLGGLLGDREMTDRGIRTAEAFLKLRRKDGMLPFCIGRQDDPPLPIDRFYEDTESECAESPHFAGMGAAALAFTFLSTGEDKYLEPARQMTLTAASHMPDFEHISRNCKSHAYARMLFPLAVLYRADRDDKWMELAAQVDDYLASKQADCGAIYEWEHQEARGFRIDTGIFDKNGETIADMLYTNNFALFNSWLAWKATGRKRHLERFERIADFLVAIQVKSDDPLIDGGWMRAFDFGPTWDWFGANHDTSWGPYVMETGWTNAPISMALSMYALDLDPFELIEHVVH